jgi:tRNA A37 threonylcarbamoyladenosine dehydratase
VDQRALDAIPIEVADVHIEFDQERAAELAGLPQADARKVILVGAGTIGSQTAMIIAREGRFSWTVVDDDRLLPHNLARHSLEFRHLCQPKAVALCHQLDGLRPPNAEHEVKENHRQ